MPSPRRHLRRPDRALSAGFDAIRAEFEVPVEFSAAAQQEAAEAVARVGAGDSLPEWTPGPRRDATDLPFVTVDPPGSTDLDQAMHLSRRGSGYRVRYAIADPAVFVVPGGALQRETHERVETVYCPDTRVPLHPPVISEAAASLLPDGDRPAVLWTIDLDSDGEQTAVAVERATVRSRAQLTYAQVQEQLDAGADRDDLPTLLAEIGLLRGRLERARGGVSLARPEQEVVDPEKGGWDLVYRAPLAVEDHGAQISLLTGMAAAGIMLEAGIGVLRTMPSAQDQDVRRLRRQARALGVEWPAEESYGSVLDRLDRSLPSTAAFLGAATVLFRGAAWTPFEGEAPDPLEHGAIAAPYAHVTAPLRRLVDRYGSELCLAATSGRETPSWVLEALPTLGEDMATGARRASAVDRACTDLVEAVLLAPHVGREFEAVAVDERTVQLRSPAVVARSQDDLPAGEDVRVRLAEADPATRTVRFARASRP